MLALKALAASNNVLVEGNHASSMSNFAAFGTWFEKAVQSVDPSVSLPYFDEEGELGGTDLYTSVWEEEVAIEGAGLNLLECGAEECQGDSTDGEVVKVTTEGKYTYVPIITHQVRTCLGAKRRG